jgi:MFS family permease
VKAWLVPARRYALPSLLYFGYTLTFWIILAFIPIYLTDTGFSHFQIGVLFAAIPLTSLLLMFPFGFFSDRVSPKSLTTLGLIIFAAFLIGLRYVGGFGGYLALFFLGGVGDALFRISCFSLFYKIIGERNKGRKLGIFTGIGLLGYGLGPLIGGSLLMGMEMKSLLWVALLLLLFPLILSLFLESVKPFKFYMGVYKKDLLRKEVIILIVLVFALATHLGAERTSLSLFLEKDAHLAMDSIGMMFCFIGLTMGTLCIINGFVSDSVSRRRRRLAHLLYIGLLLSGLFNVLMLIPKTFASVLLVRILHVSGDSTFIVSQRVTVSNLFLPERIGGSLGLVEAIHTLGIFSGMLVSGALPGYILPFVVTGSLALAVIPFAILMKPKF